MAAKAAPPRTVDQFAHPDDRNWTAHTQTYTVEECKLGLSAMNGATTCKSPAPIVRRSKKKAKDDTLVGSLCALICDHQLGIAINLILLLMLAHICFPRARRRTSKFFHLSYYNENTGLYGAGNDDIHFVALWLIIFTGLRVAVMDYILDPFARLCGMKTRKDLVRFKEQAWLICYDSTFWSLGMYIVYHSPMWLNLNGMWTGWPFWEIDALSKWYYLVQFAFWLQQILVVNIEEKRKDFAQMFTHHIFTCALLVASYGYRHTRVGIMIMTIMDVIDIILPTAKLLKYSGYTTACDVAFGIFTVVWFVTRHVLYLMVCWSIYAHAPTAMAPGCYSQDGDFVPMSSTTEFKALGGTDIAGNIFQAYKNREGPLCWNPTIRYSFLGLLMSLQVILIFWFMMVIKVVYRVLSGQGADDVRSDDEGEDSELEVEDEEEATESKTSHPISAIKSGPEWAPVEQEVGVEALTFPRRSSPSLRGYKRTPNRGSGSRTSGISIPGHGDRKELLGRIGCDKPT